MAIIKCKMCGGDMELTADKTFGTCEFCGSTMTLPKIGDEQVLNIDPECAQAYLGKLMAELQVRKPEGLKNCKAPFDDRNSYRKVLRFADTALRNTLTGYIQHIRERNEQARLEGIYARAVSRMQQVTDERALKEAAQLFESISHYKDAAQRIPECLALAETARKDGIYDAARKRMSSDRISGYQEAIRKFGTISQWKDAQEQIDICRSRIGALEAQAEQARKAAAAAAKKEKEDAQHPDPRSVRGGGGSGGSDGLCRKAGCHRAGGCH